MDKIEYIKRANEKHGYKFKYDLLPEVFLSTNKITIICPEHGEFTQNASSHLNGIGCPACSGLKKIDYNSFVKRSNEVHGNKYDYSKSIITNTRTKTIITCPIHGDFEQTPKNHLKGNGCPKCGKKYAKEWSKNNYKQYINESQKRFGKIYSFPDIEKLYENSHSKILIKCEKCNNVFEKIACDHLTSPHGGCLHCYCNKSTAEEEIINELELKYNRARQGAITQEITEIVAGSGQ